MSGDETGDGPVCALLRTKKMFYRDGLQESDPATDPHPYCWCMETMGQFGPDDGLVAARHCRPGRRCYEEMKR